MVHAIAHPPACTAFCSLQVTVQRNDPAVSDYLIITEIEVMTAGEYVHAVRYRYVHHHA